MLSKDEQEALDALDPLEEELKKWEPQLPDLSEFDSDWDFSDIEKDLGN